MELGRRRKEQRSWKRTLNNEEVSLEAFLMEVPKETRELHAIPSTPTVEGVSTHSAGGFSGAHWDLRMLPPSFHAGHILVQQKLETEIDIQLENNN